MMQYKPQRKKISVTIIVVSAIILLFLVLNVFSHSVRNIFYIASSPLQKVLWKVGESSSNFLSPFLVVHRLKNENSNLILQNNQLSDRVALLEGLEAENQVLRDALNLNLQKNYKLSLVEVISKDTSKDSILINKGSEDGISTGMPVINGQKVLFGKISEVYKNFSRVTLISEKGFVFDIKIKDKDIYGVVRGNGNLGVYLDLIPRDTEITVGDVLLTSSLEGNFPKVEDIKSFQTAEIKPFFDINSTNNLFVITNFKT